MPKSPSTFKVVTAGKDGDQQTFVTGEQPVYDEHNGLIVGIKFTPSNGYDHGRPHWVPIGSVLRVVY